MISYMEGKLIQKEEDRIILLANQVGYEVLLPVMVMDTLVDKKIGSELSFYIYYHQTERQPKPVLIGFNLEAEKKFFQSFISVEAIGPLKAVKALSFPVRDIARAIENKDADQLKKLKGIGARTAQKIIASLSGKMDKFALICEADKKRKIPIVNFTEQVKDVLVIQLGHKPADAKKMIYEALQRDSSISTAEALFDEVYRGESKK